MDRLQGFSTVTLSWFPSAECMWLVNEALYDVCLRTMSSSSSMSGLSDHVLLIAWTVKFVLKTFVVNLSLVTHGFDLGESLWQATLT